MSARCRVVACAWIGVLLLGACGRLGFDLLAGEDEVDSPRRDAGMDAGGSPPPPDMPGMEAGVDAQLGPGWDSGPRPADAGVDAAQALDAAADDDAGQAPSCSVTSVADYCTELPRLFQAAQIDGVLECGLTLQAFTPAGWTAGPPIPAGNSARYAAAWSPSGVYVFIDVDDSSRLPPPAGLGIWCGDGVEVYVDDDAAYAAAPAYDEPGTIQTIAVAPADDSNSVSTGERWRSTGAGLAGAWTSSTFASFPRPGGYVFEAFLAAAELDLSSWTLASGAAVGLNLSINVSSTADPAPAGESNDCGRRMGQYFLRVASPPCGTSCAPFLNTNAFCAPLLRD